MTTKATLIQDYEKYTACDAYIIGFSYKNAIYSLYTKTIDEHFLTLGRESSKRGGLHNLRFRPTNEMKEELINKGATPIGNRDLVFNGEYKNKGVQFEKVISEINNIPFRGKDSVPFYVAGDLELNGEQIQIKFEGASICTEKTLLKLKAS